MLPRCCFFGIETNGIKTNINVMLVLIFSTSEYL